jgi:large subunit ribosomal protein L7/L12
MNRFIVLPIARRRLVLQRPNTTTTRFVAPAPGTVIACRSLSSVDAATTTTPVEPYTFTYPKSQALFEKITSTLSKEDVRRLADATGTVLGRPLRSNEFYYVRIGKSRSRASGGSAAGDVAVDDDEAASAAAAAPAKTTVDLKLMSFDDKMKLKIIKEVRSIVVGLGLKEAKELVEGAPKVLQKDLKPEAAEELKEKLQALGAVIELV